MISAVSWRFGLAARIGFSIAAAVVAIQVLVVAVFVLTPENPPPLFGAGWLSDAVVHVARPAFSAAATDADILEHLPRVEALSVRIDHDPPRHLADPPWPLNRVVATVRNKLADHPSAAVDAFLPGPQPPIDNGPVIVPASLQATLSKGPILPGEELLAPRFFSSRSSWGPAVG